MTSDLIHTIGCVDAVENLLSDNLTVILGVGVGLLVFQLFNIMLAGGELPDGGGVWGVSLTVFICRSGIGHPQGESSYEGYEAERKVVASLNDLLFSYLHLIYICSNVFSSHCIHVRFILWCVANITQLT